MKSATLKKLTSATVLAAPAAVVVGTAVAGAGGTEFGAIVTQLTDWLEGGLN